MAGASKRNIRLSLYPKALCYCTPEVTKYALCVSNKDDIKKGDCGAEFMALKNCFQKAMKDLLTKM